MLQWVYTFLWRLWGCGFHWSERRSPQMPAARKISTIDRIQNNTVIQGIEFGSKIQNQIKMNVEMSRVPVDLEGLGEGGYLEELRRSSRPATLVLFFGQCPYLDVAGIARHRPNGGSDGGGVGRNSRHAPSILPNPIRHRCTCTDPANFGFEQKPTSGVAVWDPLSGGRGGAI